MTLAIPDDLYEVMKKHKEIKWTEVARQAIRERARKIELMDSLLSKSEITEEDAIEIGNKIKHEISKKHGLVK